MANAKRCDRCGSFYRNNKFNTNLYNTCAIDGFKYTWSDGDTGERIDLCDECQAALDKFMKMEE